MELYIPPNYDETDKKLLFLAGPIQSAPRWQDEAINFFFKRKVDFNIACPRYALLNERTTLDWTPGIDSTRQIDWEGYHLNKAGDKYEGCILFWLPREKEHFCERAYAQTSRIELGEWLTRHKLEGTKISLGIEECFSGGDYLRYRLSKECPEIRISSNLTETCKNALEILGN